ncbi:MAG: TonB-dependent receptor [Sphingomonadales bacterium]|nr:TonB-dependent receptor [Sphingomonadales bacterium]MDE2567342.1 TonB-dependent receptor [Sphingomonadales bacterium]
MRAALPRVAKFALLATTALCATAAQAQDKGQASGSEDSSNTVIIVTAQKRSENLQNVPISIQALSTKKLADLNVTDFSGYAQQLPSVTFQALGGNPGVNVIYMRGVASGGDGNHSGSLPSVGVYLDEQPVTTIGGNLDVHIYDIARIESLSGPQGTLYGASSEAGTIRIITNKPDTSGFYGSIDSDLNTVKHGGVGGSLDAMLNMPLSANAALRVVGFYEHDAGFIDNVPGCRSFLPETNPLGCPPATNGGISVNNAAYVKRHANQTDVWGGRAALKVDLNDNWTVTPAVTYQETRSHGTYAYDPSVGDLQVQRFYPEYRKDRYVQAALTIEGKIGNWDLTSATAYLDRRDTQLNDYTDYAEAYDSYYAAQGGLASYFYYQDAAGNTIDPRQRIVGTDHFKKFSQELRIASPSDAPLRFVGGLFFQRQSNFIHQDYQIPGLGPLVSVNGMPGTLWLTQQYRADRDYAAFGELSYDLTPTVTLTAGARAFKYDNSLIGFFGFGRNPGNGFTDSPYNAAGSSKTGVVQCFTNDGGRLYDNLKAGTGSTTLLAPVVPGSPCTNLGVYSNGTVGSVVAKGDGTTYRFNATWKPTHDVMLYATVSKGFRPGGINRRGDFGPYQPDYLINYELGFKTTLADGLVRLNGAIYQQDWQHFQFSYLGPNSFTVIVNGPNARIRGFDVDAAIGNGPLTFNVTAAYTDAVIRQNLCHGVDATFTCTTPLADGSANSVDAAAGTRLPITPQFKASGTARYTVPVGAAKVYGQVNATYQSSASSDLRTSFANAMGRLDAFGQVNLKFGADWDKYSIAVYVQNLFDERGQLSKFIGCGLCTQRTYIVPTTPRMFGLSAGAKF